MMIRSQKLSLNKIFGTIGVLALSLFTMQACEKDPYIPNTPPVVVEIGSGDATYNANNDAQPKLTSLRVMTYNIHAAVPPSKAGETDIPAIAKVIRDANADIVFLQEVDKNTGRNGYSGDMAKELASQTQMNQAFYSATSVSRGFYGIAILSKYPLKMVKKHTLTQESPSTEPRVLGTAIIDLPGQDSVLAAGTHLQHNSATNRVQQIRDVVRILSVEKIPMVLGGDLNEFESATAFFDVFDGAFTRTCKGAACPPTFTAQLPRSVIDYLAYRPSTAFSIASHTTIPEFYASDHLPVLAVLTFNR